jgi:hypothetical protein
MKFNPEAQEYLDRYFFAIKNELPAGQREDIVAELRSNLMDSMEESYPNTSEIDKQTMREILIQNGSPREVAATYHGPRYLIGPKLYPLFIQVLRIVLTVLGTVLTVVFIINTFINPYSANELFGSVLEFIGGLWNALLGSAATITLVFAIMERKSEGKLDDFDTESWNPDDLPEIVNTQNIKNWEHIVGIVGGLFWISIIIYLMNSGNLYVWNNTERFLAGTINEGFKALLPYMITIAGLELANHAVILSQQTYSAFSRWFKIVLEVLNAVILGISISLIPLFNLIWSNFPAEFQPSIEILDPMIHKTFRGFLIFVLCISIIGIIKRIFTELKRNPSRDYQY